MGRPAAGRRGGASGARLVATVLLLAAGLSAILTPNGAVAALLPMTVLVALRLGPRAVEAADADGVRGARGLAAGVDGSPVNVLVADEAGALGVGRFGFFAFALVGVPLVVGAVAIACSSAPRLLPEREPRALSADLSGHARTLMRAVRASTARCSRGTRCPSAVHAPLRRRRGRRPAALAAGRRDVLPGMTTPSGDLLVLAVQRGGRDAGPARSRCRGRRAAAEGSWEALDEHLGDDNVLVVDSPDAMRRQVVPLGAGATPGDRGRRRDGRGLATGACRRAVAGVLAAVALVVLGVLRIEDAYRAVSWTTVILIAGLIPVSAALQSTGAADDIAAVLLDVVGDAGPHAARGLFLVAAAFSIAVSNTATALILIPVGSRPPTRSTSRRARCS